MFVKPKCALIIGASDGIGKALSLLLAKEGIHLILVGRKMEKLNEVARTIGDRVEVQTVAADLLEPEQRKSIIQLIHEKTPDLVVNSAARGKMGNILSRSTEDALKTVELNVSAVLEITIEAARALVSANKPGTILNISASIGFQIFPGFATYVASKGFITRISESFDEELKPFNVRVLSFCPGIVNTNFASRSTDGKQQKPHPLGMKPEDVAESIWKQIQRGQQTKFYNSLFAFGAFMAKYILPKKVLLLMAKGIVDGMYNDPVIEKK